MRKEQDCIKTKAVQLGLPKLEFSELSIPYPPMKGKILASVCLAALWLKVNTGSVHQTSAEQGIEIHTAEEREKDISAELADLIFVICITAVLPIRLRAPFH